MAGLMRARDWSTTPLGDPRGWPDGLTIPLRMLLTSRFEMWLGWGPDLRFFYNDAYLPTLGIKHPDMLGRPFREVWSEVYHEVESQVALVRAGEATWNDALLLLLERSGYAEETYHSFSYSPLYGGGGTVDGMLCIVSEVTERVISERRLETLRRLGMELVGVEAPEQVSQAVCRAFGANRLDFPFALVFFEPKVGVAPHPCTDDAAHLVGRLQPDAFSAAERVTLAGMNDLPTGHWGTPAREALVVPIPGAGEQPAFGSLVLGLNPYRRDDSEIEDFARLIAGQISGALANIATLTAERQRAQMIWTHSRGLMVVVDPGGIFRSVSPAWTRLLGHPVEEVVGRSFDDFMAPADVADSHVALETALADGDLTGYENRFLTTEGEVRTFSWHTATADGLVFAYGRDVTDQKANAAALARAEETLRQTQKMEAVGQLTGGIAHDFNNMLTGVIGAMDIMKHRLTAGRTDDLERFMDAANTSAQRAAAVTARLLAFSRRQSLDSKPIDVVELTNGLSDLFTRSIGENISLRIASQKPTLLAIADANQLENAILNLVINARDAMPDGGQLTVELSEVVLDETYTATRPDIAPGRYILLAVSDTGVGMPVDVQRRAFEPFFSTKPTGQGTGLGLSMVYGFARQSGGQVRIHSATDQGTSVKLYLPAAPTGVVAQPELQASIRHGGSGQTVLLVEDDASVRLLVREVLNELGYRTLEAGSSDDALPIIRGNCRIDLLVSDVGLPGMNGRQLAEVAREHRPDLPILFVTGYAENAAIRAGFLGTGMAMITKPFAIEALSAKIAEMVALTTGVRA